MLNCFFRRYFIFALLFLIRRSILLQLKHLRVSILRSIYSLMLFIYCWWLICLSVDQSFLKHWITKKSHVSWMSRRLLQFFLRFRIGMSFLTKISSISFSLFLIHFCLCISYCLGKDGEYSSTEIRALVSLQRELS